MPDSPAMNLRLVACRERKSSAWEILTRFELCVAIQETALALLNRFKVALVLFRFGQFAKEAELCIKVTSFHAFLELG